MDLYGYSVWIPESRNVKIKFGWNIWAIRRFDSLCLLSGGRMRERGSTATWEVREDTTLKQWQSRHTWGSPTGSGDTSRTEGTYWETHKRTKGVSSNPTFPLPYPYPLSLNPLSFSAPSWLRWRPASMRIQTFSWSVATNFSLYHLTIWFRTTWCGKEVVRWSTSGWPPTQRLPSKTRTPPPQEQPGEFIYNLKNNKMYHSSNNSCSKPSPSTNRVSLGAFGDALSSMATGVMGSALRSKTQTLLWDAVFVLVLKRTSSHLWQQHCPHCN